MDTWRLNDNEYFERNGLSLLMEHNQYAIGKQGGIELIQHDHRVMTNIGLRRVTSPGDFYQTPEKGSRQVTQDRSEVHFDGRFAEFTFQLRIKPLGDWIHFVVEMNEPFPREKMDQIAFQFEFAPDIYCNQSFFFGDQFGMFPLAANGPIGRNAASRLELLPIGVGRNLSIAPEDSLHYNRIERIDGGQ